MPRASAGLLLFQVARFGGLNRRVNKFFIDDVQCQDILNFTFSDRGSLSKISGYEKWNATSLGASKMLGGERFYKDGTPAQFVEAHNGKLYKGDDITKTFTEIATGLNATAKWYMKINRNLLFMMNGIDEHKKWDGTTVTRWGTASPTVGPTAADGGAGAIGAGTYFWRYTFVTATMETHGSPNSNGLTLGASRQASLTGVAVSANPAVTKRRVYRTAAGGSDFFFVGEIPDNTTTVFTDNIADSALGSAMPLFKDPPPAGNKYVEQFKNRLWLAGDTTNPRRLVFSEYFEPEAFPTTFFVDLPMTPGDEITGLKVLGDVLVVYGHNTPFLVIGETPFDFTVKRSFAQTGTESIRTVVLVENAHIYLSRFGVYAFDGAISRLLSDDIDPLIREINLTQIGNSSAGYHDKSKVYRLAVSNGASATNNAERCLDLRHNAWFSTDRTIEYYHPLDGPGDKGELFTASPTIGHLYQEDVGDTADGSNFTIRWTSKAYTLGTIDFTKQLRHILFWSTPTQFPITLAVEVDDDATRAQTFTIPTSSLLPLYGSGLYGTAVYGGPGIVRVANVFQQKMLGNYAEIAIEATAANKPLTIYFLEVSYRVNTHLRIK